MVNPDVDSYAKTLNHRKIIRKTQRNNNLLKTKRILKPKYHLRWRRGFRPSASSQLHHTNFSTGGFI